jgi:hypothetical protein
MLAILITSAPHDVEKQDAALRSVDPIVGNRGKTLKKRLPDINHCRLKGQRKIRFRGIHWCAPKRRLPMAPEGRFCPAARKPPLPAAVHYAPE